MIRRTKCNLLYLLTFMSLILISPTNSCGANYPLEIINIKPAGTGSPAISSTNRIFRAYPGVEYNIRAAVIGGSYPYTFTLSNQPSGMTINSSTGEISWPNPQSNSGTITLSVTDSENVTVSTSWVISVTTNGFIFVNSNYVGSTETGSISQPYKTINSMLTMLTESAQEYIVYFRSGSYTLPSFHQSYYYGLSCNLSESGYLRPYKWLGYPGETVNIDANGHYFEVNGVYFDKLNIFNFKEYGFRAGSSSNYSTIRRCNLNGLTSDRTSNSNQGFYFTIEEGVGYYLVFQDNVISNYVSSAGIGSLYQQHKLLIENNNISTPLAGSINSIQTAIALKYNPEGGGNNTIRRNTISVDRGTVLGFGVNGMLNGVDDSEICFNYFNASNGTAHRFNNDGNQWRTYFYRNTVVGKIQMVNLNGLSCSGPFIFNNNVLINNDNGIDVSHYTNTNNPQNCITATSNLIGTISNNILGGNGELTSNYSQYVGTRGWQIDSKSYVKHYRYCDDNGKCTEVDTNY
jgi:hypothetical protein